MNKIAQGVLLPSAAMTIANKQIKQYKYLEKKPEVGDLVYGEIIHIGQDTTFENKHGRLHTLYHGTRAVFVFGNRYAPDYYEGLVPDTLSEELDLLTRAGVVGIVKTKSSKVIDPTRIKIYGYIFDKEGCVINTKNFPLIIPKNTIKKNPRSRMILVCGTAMNSGKSTAAVACCRTLASLGYRVIASKITGTARLKDILLMNDAGARNVCDFTYFGYPSTYLLSEWELLHIFNSIDLKYANNDENFWVVEIADGIIQRETAILLNSPVVKSRIHRLVFCASDAFGAIGGLKILQDQFDLVPNAISGICTSSPLHIRELKNFTSVPIFSSNNINIEMLEQILLSKKSRKRKQILKTEPKSVGATYT